MQIKCEYCRQLIDDSLAKCPYCGASNTNMQRIAQGTPKTIEELKQWYADRHLPPYEVTRFFIGINYTQPKAFGIYKEENTGNFIVYKNKDNGQRAIRYRGTDEDYAVNELYLKLKSEILNQKSIQQNGIKNTNTSQNSSKPNIKLIVGIILGIIGWCGLIILNQTYHIMDKLLVSIGVALVLTAITWIFFGLINLITNLTIKKSIIKISKKFKHIKVNFIVFEYIIWFLLFLPFSINYGTPKYYEYKDAKYCVYQSDYYEYDGYDYYKVDESDLPSKFINNIDDYSWDIEDAKWSEHFTSFEDSDCYEDMHTSSSDSSYDWDSGSSWDSGGTDWGSDW